MHFDDRLATVLRTRASGDVAVRIQFRQLLDLLGTKPAEMRGPQIDAGYDRLAELADAIPPQECSAIIGEAGSRIRSPRLVASLAAGDAAVASAAIAKARLSEEQWLDLVPALPVQARSLLRQRRDLGDKADGFLARLGIRDRGLTYSGEPQPAAHSPQAWPAPVPANDELPSPRPETIGSLVKRIEAFRKARRDDPELLPASAESPRLPLGEEPVLRALRQIRSFDFATDAGGRIVWADPGVAPMATGLLLASRDPSSPVEAHGELVEAVQRRQPIRAGRIVIAGSPAISGDWQVDAMPSFDPVGGRFAGYRGRMRRPATIEVVPLASPEAPDSESDRIRQLLHELRTPVNAIQGFAEIIQQQLFGPTPHEYRALAASIAADGARMLAGFEELERLARLESGALELDAGECDLGKLVAATVAQLEHHTTPRSSGFSLRLDDGEMVIPLAQTEAERLVWRLLATLAGVAAPGEMLKLRVRRQQDGVRMTMQLPATLAARSDDDFFQAGADKTPQALSAGMFGTGFALRLAASEARGAGGLLEKRDEKLLLTLPGLTGMAHDHSQGGTAGVSLKAGHEN